MLRIEINGQPAHIKKGTSIKVTRENPRYTDSGDYTLEVTFPIDGCPENMKIFGPLHRPETEKARLAKTTYQFSLTADELNLEGTAVVTSVNEKEVKLQFLAGRSELNFKTTHPDGTDIYIDQLDLGIVYPGCYTDIQTWVGGDNFPDFTDGIKPAHAQVLCLFELPFVFNRDTMMYGTSDQTDCVCFPIYSTAESRYANARRLHAFYDPDTAITRYYYIIPFAQNRDSPNSLPHLHPSEAFEYHLDASVSFAPQPYLCFILEKVLEAIGTPLSRADNCIRSTWMKDIFIANSFSTVHIAKTLPHWTVQEFIQEVQNFFGVSIRAVAGRAVVVPRNTADRTVPLTLVDDQYSVEVEDQPQKEDISSVNVAFDYPETSNYEVLPEEVWNIAKIVTEDESDADTKNRGRHLIRLTPDGTTQVLTAYKERNGGISSYCPVDYCAPYYQDPTRRDTDMTLRIVPVKTIYRPANSCLNYVKAQDGYYHFTDPDEWFRTASEYYYNAHASGPKFNGKYEESLEIQGTVEMQTSEQIVYTDLSELTILGLVEGVQNIVEKTTMEVAYNNGGKTTHLVAKAGGKYHTTIEVYDSIEGRPFHINYDDELPVYGATQGKFLITEQSIPAPDTFRTTVIDPASDVDTYTKHVFDFVDRGFFSPSDDYIIRGRLYACEKIEYTINENGLDPKKKIHLFEKKTS